MIKRLRTDERGAMAVIVTLMSTVLLASAAFAVDLANAFAVKRQLSVAADASAIAGAQEVNAQIPTDAIQAGFTCNEAALQPIAQAAATSTNQAARGDATLDSVTVDCSNFPTDVKVTVVNRRSTPSFFGQFANQSGFSAANTATARVFVPDTTTGLRPIAACAIDTTAANIGIAGGNLPFVVAISKEDGVCGTANSGEWGFTNFLDQGEYGEWNQPTSPIYFPAETCAGAASPGGGNAGCQAQWIEQGYFGPVVVPNRTEAGGDPTVPGLPGNGAAADVMPKPSGNGIVTNGGGISGNTGIVSSTEDEISGLVGKTIDLPVAKRYIKSGKRIDVVGAVTVTVCSAKVGKGAGGLALGTAPTACGSQQPVSGNIGFDYWSTIEKNNEGALWVKPVLFTSDGTVGGPATGCLGNENCDFGRRAVQLFR